MASEFSWIPMHREAIHRILAYRDDQDGLLNVLREMKRERLKVISLEDHDLQGNTIPLAEIDPFTFLATFNRGVTEKNRQDNWAFLKKRWDLQAAVPEDFTGLPVLHNLCSWLFPYAAERESGHVDNLWQIASQAADGEIERVNRELFDACLKLARVAIGGLTIGMFWINPQRFLPADNKTRAYSKAKGVEIEPRDYQSYRQWVKDMTERLSESYPQISHAAHLFAIQGSQPPDTPSSDDTSLGERPEEPVSRQYWTLSAGAGGEHWEEFYEKGIAAIGWDGTHDLRQFKNKEELRQKLRELWPGDSSKRNDAHTCWQFVHDIEVGDIIFAKQGLTKLLGYGVVEGEYEFDEKRTHYKHVRKVKWLAKGDWEMPEDSKMALKTLTDITLYPDFVKLISSKVGLEPALESKPVVVMPPASGSTAYWWLTANPKIWSFESLAVGQKETYTSHNEKGNNRRIFRYFQEVKAGDIVVGYVASPQRAVVAVCRITKGLHQTGEGEAIEFENVERLPEPIPYETLQTNSDFANSEPLINNNQGSLFKLREQEYEIIRSLIDDTPVLPRAEIEYYDKKKAMDGLFLAEAQFDEMLDALREKKNVVLQGAPGVGKTYIARRLAHALIGSNDPQRIEMIQFHQSYCYEDFVQGYRPTPKGQFSLKYGVFHQFCRRAQRDESRSAPYVFIIDEINRGNLSKIFGELMMLIEPDKRGVEYAIPLAYSEDADERFYIPENLHLIGMMNTADRSLAMVDYALRRRFRFMTLRPEFISAAFRDFLITAGATADLVEKIVSRMTTLNEIISADTKNLGPGYQIGHSYFCPRNGITPDEQWYRRVVDAEIVPLIQEYWFDNEQKVEDQHTALLA
jgi:5-methylcytosine-specific restriction protein B